MSQPDSMQTKLDGGYGWVVVAGAFVANAVGFGILYSFTVFFPAILQEFGHGRGGVSVIPSVAAAVMLAAGAVIGRLTDRVGPRRMIASGSVLLAAGLLFASISRSIWHVYISYGLLLGIGVGLAFLPSNTAVGQWFQRRRGLATGIAVAGSGVGAVVLAPISQRLIASYDWRVALRVLAVGGFVLLCFVASVVRARTTSKGKSVLGKLRSDRQFRTLYMAAFVASYGYWVPFVHIVPYARDQGLTATDAALLVSVMGVFNIVGRVVLGAIADRLGRRRMLQISVGAMSVAVLFWPVASTKGGLLLFVAAYGFFAGSFISLLFALTADYFGVERLAGVTGLLNSGAALGTLVGAPVSGALFDATGSYTLAVILAGASMALGAAVLFRLPPIPSPTA